MNEDWLSTLKAMGKGPLAMYAARHAPFRKPVALQADYTGAALIGQVRSYPDAGTILVSFTVTGPTVVAGTTTFILSLTEAQIEALPSAPAGDGSVTLVYDLLLTPSGGTKELLFGGNFIVTGGSTNV